MPDTISARVIDSGAIGGPPVSASAVAVDAGLAVPPVTVTLPMASRV
jgi:hypothetical protein